jgi:hypothetical protein
VLEDGDADEVLVIVADQAALSLPHPLPPPGGAALPATRT